MEPDAALETNAASALRKAVDRLGSQSAMAQLLGVTQPAVSKWLASSKMLPPEHVLLVERETGIPKEVLRPDIYPDESDRPAHRLDHAARDVGPLDDLAPAR